MSDQQSVWPDGAREAVDAAHDRWIRRSGFDPTSVADDILTALEPFVQQRIAKATEWIDLDRQAACRSFQECEAKLHEAETRNGITGGVYTELYALRAEVARLREDGERRQSEVLQLRALVAALPIGECQASAALQGWWDQMKAVMAGTNPVWLVEPRGCPTPGACSCPGVRLDAARSARGGEG